MVINELKQKYTITAILEAVDIPRSTYYYYCKQLKKTDKYAAVKAEMKKIWHECSENYGYRRMTRELAIKSIPSIVNVYFTLKLTFFHITSSFLYGNFLNLGIKMQQSLYSAVKWVQKNTPKVCVTSLSQFTKGCIMTLKKPCEAQQSKDIAHSLKPLIRFQQFCTSQTGNINPTPFRNKKVSKARKSSIKAILCLTNYILSPIFIYFQEFKKQEPLSENQIHTINHVL